MVIVITVLGLLMAFLIPKITEAQAKARDIRRQSDITMISTALVSYKHDHGKFPWPATTWKCITEYQDQLSGYLTSIPQDPSGKWLQEYAGMRKSWCETWYVYITNSDRTNFILVYAIDQSPPNWNYYSSEENGGGVMNNFFNKSIDYISEFKYNLTTTTNWNYFVYIYK